MKIAVNTRLLLSGKLEGIGMVCYELLKRITANHPEHEFIFIFDRPFSKEFVFSDNVVPVVAYPPARDPILWNLFFEYGLNYVLKKYNPNVFVSPESYVCLKTKQPSINIIHDLNFLHYPQFFPNKRHLSYFIKNTPKFINKVNKIITVSQYTKQDIVNNYMVDENKIDVVYNASSNNYKPLSCEDQIAFRNKFSDGCRYFSYVGAFYKRKNIKNILLAFDMFKDSCNENIKLVLVGNKKSWDIELENVYNKMKFKNDVVFAGYLNQDKLNKVLASSIALLYVSIFEGFGIPIVEAFNAETAVITSNTSSMPEIAGDSAMLVDPFNVTEIKNAMTSVCNNNNLRQQLINKGKIRKTAFNWDVSANAFYDNIMQLV